MSQEEDGHCSKVLVLYQPNTPLTLTKDSRHKANTDIITKEKT